MTKIRDYLTQLIKLQEDIRKLGPKRRIEALGLKKFLEVKTLYIEVEKYIGQFSSRLERSEVSVEDSKVVQSIYLQIKDTYNKILTYYEVEKEQKMAPKDNFDLKTAVSLLPTMDGSEAITNKLIDGIELYSEMIEDSDAQLLIKFVLKTRLTQSAKLRLSSTYVNVEQMINDMRKHLLTKKSDTALQKKLMTAKQGNRSIEQFGQELEELFVNLTISQANGNTASYDVLKPLNEKLAINRFAQGLRSEKLNTIIAARAYSSLKDAIQGAKDEEVSMIAPTNPEQIFFARGKGYIYRKPFRGSYNSNGNRGTYPRNKNQHERTNGWLKPRRPFMQPRGTYTRTYSRGRRQNNNYSQHKINAAVEKPDNENDNELKFFREWQLHSDL